MEFVKDKVGESQLTQTKVLRLSSFLLLSSKMGSVDFNIKHFTWEKHIHGHLIYECSDRAIPQHEWLHLYPKAIVAYWLFTHSEHCYILLYIVDPLINIKHPTF